MANYPLDLLARANPVRDLPSVESPERLRRLIEATHPEASIAGRGRAWTRPRLVRAVAATSLAGAAVALGLALTNGSSSPKLNVVASAYAALTPEDSIIEASFVRREMHGQERATYNQREWLDARTGDHRTQSQAENGDSAAETAVGDGWVENWSGANGEQDVIHRWYSSRFAGKGGAGSAIDAYRQLYLDKTVQLVGQVSWHGKLLWKLEGPGSGYHDSHQSPVVPIETIVVLVDPTTYLPVVRQSISLTKPEHPIETETELVEYKRLPVNPENEALLKVSPHHPNARVETRHVA